MSLRFFIAGIPRSTQTGSIITVNGRSFPVRRNTPWSSVCGLVARQHAPRAPLEGPLRVDVEFRLPRPKSGRRQHPTTRPDAENLIKGLLDSWNGTLWMDDSQIVDLRLRKVYAEAPGVLVEVDELVTAVRQVTGR